MTVSLTTLYFQRFNLYSFHILCNYNQTFPFLQEFKAGPLEDTPASEEDFCITCLISVLTGSVPFHNCPIKSCITCLILELTRSASPRNHSSIDVDEQATGNQVSVYRMDITTWLRPHGDKNNFIRAVKSSETVQYLLLAEGNEVNVCIPSSFNYVDPTTRFQMRSRCICSVPLLDALRDSWAREKETYKTRQKKKAKGLPDYHHWKEFGIDSIIFERHARRPGDNTLRGFAADNQAQIDAWLSVNDVRPANGLTGVIMRKSKLERFCTDFLRPPPVSFVYPTAKLHLNTVAVPQFIGKDGGTKLYVSNDEKAHMRFSKPGLPPHHMADLQQDVTKALSWEIQEGNGNVE